MCVRYFETLATAEVHLGTIIKFVAGILRLSTKYLMESLRKRCIAMLETKIPTTFAQFNAMTELTNKRPSSEHLMQLVHIAEENMVPTLLPYAYYCISRLAIERILEDNEDDIPWRLKTICLVGRERLRRAEMSLSHSFLLAFLPVPTCVNLCLVSRGPDQEWHRIQMGKAPHPLKRFGRWNDMRVCGDCLASSQLKHESGRAEVWLRLPTFFELAPWDELQKRQARINEGY